MWELLAEGLLWTPGCEILLNGTRSVVKTSFFLGATGNTQYQVQPWDSFKSPSAHTL